MAAPKKCRHCASPYWDVEKVRGVGAKVGSSVVARAPVGKEPVPSRVVAREDNVIMGPVPLVMPWEDGVEEVETEKHLEPRFVELFRETCEVLADMEPIEEEEPKREKTPLEWRNERLAGAKSYGKVAPKVAGEDAGEGMPDYEGSQERGRGRKKK